MARYEPIVLSCEMGDQGYWLVTWSVAPGLRAAVTACRVGISRSEAIEATRQALPGPGTRLEANG